MLLWCIFGLSAVVTLIFAVLCALSYQVTHSRSRRAAGGAHAGQEGEEADDPSHALPLCNWVQDLSNATAGLAAARGPADLSVFAWESVMWGVSVSAVFAFIVGALFHVSRAGRLRACMPTSPLCCESNPTLHRSQFGTVCLLVFSFRSLGHPARGFSRGCILAAAAFSLLFILSITLHWISLEPVATYLNEQSRGANLDMLRACIAFG